MQTDGKPKNNSSRATTQYIYIVADPGWWDSHPVLGTTLTTTASGVYNASWLSTGLGSRVFNRDTNVILNLTSWGNRIPGSFCFVEMVLNAEGL